MTLSTTLVIFLLVTINDVRSFDDDGAFEDDFGSGSGGKSISFSQKKNFPSVLRISR